MWKFIGDVVHDFVSSLQLDVGRGFLHVSNVFLFILCIYWPATMFNEYDFNLCVSYPVHALRQRWSDERVQSMNMIEFGF